MTNEEAYKWIYIHFAPCGDETKQDEAISIALKAIAKQIPKKLGSKVLDYLGRARPECGNCGDVIEDTMWSYCPWCGQKIGDE